jgi:hypothetical protein
MARFNFGGDIHDLIARPDANAGGGLKLAPGATIQFFSAATGGTVVTDYVIDGVNATSIVVKATGYLPDFQGPDGVDTLYYDPDPNDADVTRVRYIARDAGAAAGLTPASTTQQGVVRLPTSTERAAGTSTTTAMTPADVADRIATHNSSTSAHPDLAASVDALSSAVAGKADKVQGTVPPEQLPASTGATANMLALRDANGTFSVGTATLDAHPAQLKQVTDAIKASTVTGTDVRHREIASGSLPVSVTNSTTLVDVPTLSITDARSGQTWRVDCDLCFRGVAAGGVKLQFKAPAAAVTNLLPNPSFETDVSGWSANNIGGTPARDTVQGGQSGTANMAVTTSAATAATVLIVSQWFDYTQGDAYSAGVYMKRSSATGRGFRADIQFGTSAAVDYNVSTGVIAGVGANSTAVTSSTAFQQAKVENVSTTDTTATKVRIRLAITSSVTGDVHHVDAVQLEKGTTLPAFGNTGGASTSLTGVGSINDPTSAARPGFRGSIAAMTAGLLGASTDAWVQGSFLMKIGGTDLINQTLALQFAQATANATATQLVEGNATFARVV